jgi:secreted trypsin-like serine protease
VRGKTPIFPVEPLNNFSVSFQVTPPFTYGTGVQPISMISTEPAAGSPSAGSGWGALSSDDTTLLLQLQAVEVNITVRTACNISYVPDREITVNMICAGVAGLGICNGDFGGPLVVGG